MRRWCVFLGAALATAPIGARAQDQLPDESTDVTGVIQAKALAAEQAKAAARHGAGVVQAGPVDPARYVLGPGDALELNLWGRVARTMPMDVSPEGRILLPGRGPVDVSGKTLAWARERILRLVADQYVGVHADVQLVQLRTFKVYLSGELKAPGAVEATSATRASEVLVSAGLQPDASRRNIVVRHADSTVSRVDLEAFERLGRQDLNPLLMDGDAIVVPHAREYASIAGAVARPITLELAEGDQVHTLVDFAGGLITAASPERAFMVRFLSPTERESLLVDLRDPGVGTRPLRDGDRLFVQFRPEYHFLPSVQIVGEVEHPGDFPIVLGRSRLSELLGWAGGFRPVANRAAVHLFRESEAGKQQDPEFDRLSRLSRNDMTESEYAKLETKLAERKNSFTIDWNRVQPGSDNDPLLQDRDVVRVDRFVPTVRIEGQVRRPGYVDYSPGRTLGQYIQLAGGFTERAARASVRVTRSLTGQIIPARSVRGVQVGDFIWVPERRDFDSWTAFRDIVTVAGQVAVVIFTLSR